jgi:hypothetical protein
MRKTIMTAAAAFVIGGIATGAVLSHAQPASPPAAQVDGAPPPPPRPWAGWLQHRHPGPDRADWRGREGGLLRNFALVYRQADRQLSPEDVQKIAEAFLLWNGNHTWKVTDVAATGPGRIGFSLSTPEGSVVAKFTIDPHSAKLERVG